jgi:hypothetical protein
MFSSQSGRDESAVHFAFCFLPQPRQREREEEEEYLEET